ncbi:MAG: hypothetical protein ND866_02410 [Pyrinomonadaceae bacterium]|nr:hypothetical protein [Pyrinomonadaceae bacterium]
MQGFEELYRALYYRQTFRCEMVFVTRYVRLMLLNVVTDGFEKLRGRKKTIAIVTNGRADNKKTLINYLLRTK